MNICNFHDAGDAHAEVADDADDADNVCTTGNFFFLTASTTPIAPLVVSTICLGTSTALGRLSDSQAVYIPTSITTLELFSGEAKPFEEVGHKCNANRKEIEEAVKRVRMKINNCGVSQLHFLGMCFPVGGS